MNKKNIGEVLLDNFFGGISPLVLWDSCPNQMLWENIQSEDASVISERDIPQYLQGVQAVFVLPEPLPALYIGIKPTYKNVSCSKLICDLNAADHLFDADPTYIISCDYAWMIVLTPENTPSGERLCVLVRSHTI